MRAAILRDPTIDWSGLRVTLVSRSWTAGLDSRWPTGGVSYRQPLHIEVDGGPDPVPIRDHVMIARVTTAVLILIAALMRRSRHDR